MKNSDIMKDAHDAVIALCAKRIDGNVPADFFELAVAAYLEGRVTGMEAATAVFAEKSAAVAKPPESHDSAPFWAGAMRGGRR